MMFLALCAVSIALAVTIVVGFCACAMGGQDDDLLGYD